MHRKKTRHVLRFVLAVILIGVAGVGAFYLYRSYRTTAQNLVSMRERAMTLDQMLSQANYENTELGDALYSTQAKLSLYETEISELIKRVDDYQRLQTLDSELLQKYSKVYFLNEHYVPSGLTKIPEQYVNGKGRVLELHEDVWPYMQGMLDAAAAEKFGLRITSAYRSFKTQASLKSAYTVQYGSGANRFSADQGYSEHQLGTTVDFTTVKTGDLSVRFEQTPEFKWLVDHAHEYGFVLSYPKNNKYYIYEPWHWRFVGIALASMLHEQQNYLYDIEQREIDEYLLEIFHPRL